MKDKLRICPHCNKPMKFRGSRIWHCNPCHTSYHYISDVEYEKNEDGSIKKNWRGKPKVKSRSKKDKKWKCAR